MLVVVVVIVVVVLVVVVVVVVVVIFLHGYSVIDEELGLKLTLPALLAQ